MAEDLLLYIVLGISQVAMAVAGGIVSAKTLDKSGRLPWLALFLVLGAIGCVLILLTGVRAYDAQVSNATNQIELKSTLEATRGQLTQVLLSEEFLKGQVNALAMVAAKNPTDTVSAVLSRISAPAQPRRRWLTGTQIDKLKSVLLSAPGIIQSLDYCGGDQEAKDYGDQIMDQFTVNHWTVWRHLSLKEVDFYGVRIYLKYTNHIPDTYIVLKKALAAAGIAADYHEEQYNGSPPHSIAIEVCHNPV